MPFDVTDWTTDHVVARELESGAELLVFAARRRDVEDLMEALLGAGIYPAAVVPRVAALAGLVGEAAAPSCGWTRRRRTWPSAGTAAWRWRAPCPCREESPAEAAARETRVALLAAGASPDDCATYAGGRGPAAGRVQEPAEARSRSTRCSTGKTPRPGRRRPARRSRWARRSAWTWRAPCAGRR